MQATVRGYDPVTRAGSVFLDDGTVVAFGPAALAGSGVRLLRPGQRVTLGCDPAGAITGLTLAGFPLAGFPLAGAAGRDAQPGAAAAEAAKGAS